VMRSLLKRATAAVVLVIGLFGCAGITQKQELSDRQKTAMSMFQERCKKAGEFVSRTVDDVEGIYLIRIRPEHLNYGDQYALDDPYGSDFGGDAYIKSFLRGDYEFVVGKSEGNSPRGYAFVELTDSIDGAKYRYTGSVKPVVRVRSVMSGGDGKSTFTTSEFVLEREMISSLRSRYGVAYEDISTRENRDYWIAGSALRIVDLQTGEVIAERVGYMFDVLQGSKAGGRSPWLLAANHSCPSFRGTHAASDQSRQTDRFVEKVLIPKNH